MKSSVLCTSLLFLNGTKVAKYAYIFWLKNPTSFADDFWCHFLSLWIYLTTLLWMYTLNYLTGRTSVAYLICTGQGLTTPDRSPATAYTVYAVILLASLIIHIFINVKIKIYKERTVGESSTSKKYFMANMDIQTLTNYSTNFVILIVLLVSVFFMHKLNQIELIQVNEFPNYIYVYYINLFSPVFVINLNIISLFRKDMIRKSFKEEFSSLIQRFAPVNSPNIECCR